eukprot:SAG25_NODE_9388_length_374_cov_1.181818_2_plen_37_part_01
MSGISNMEQIKSSVRPFSAKSSPFSRLRVTVPTIGSD